MDAGARAGVSARWVIFTASSLASVLLCHWPWPEGGHVDCMCVCAAELPGSAGAHAHRAKKPTRLHRLALLRYVDADGGSDTNDVRIEPLEPS